MPAADAANLRRTDAKAFFANERTFLHWMSTAVTLGSISAALLGISGHGHRHWGSGQAHRYVLVRVLALISMAVAIALTAFAGLNFYKRGQLLHARLDGPYYGPPMPILLSATLGIILTITFFGTVLTYEADGD